MRAGMVRSAAAMALAASMMMHTGTAHAVKAFSSSGGLPAVPLDGFTTVAKLKVPPGTYAISGNGVIRNSDTTSVAYVECSLSANSGTTGGFADLTVPIALSPGVSGGANWSFSTTLDNATNAPTRVTVSCGNFGPAADAKLEGSFWNLVAIPLTGDRHTTYGN